MPFAVHALDIADVIILLSIFFGVGLLPRRCNLCVAKLPARQIVIMELIEVFTDARQYQNTGTARHCRASVEQKNRHQDCQDL